MTYPTAIVLLDSINEQGSRLTTFQVMFHRFILPEVNTHRALSRNYRSSRAVPAKKLIQEVLIDPAMPVRWQRNQPGMQGGDDLTGHHLENAKATWLAAASHAASFAQLQADFGVHKGIVNRIIEPYLMIHGVISATAWSNYYALRHDEMAQPEFYALADVMWEAQKNSKPKLLKLGQWHLPYVDENDRTSLTEYPLNDELAMLRKLSVARVARVSYKTFDGLTDPQKDMELHDRLLIDGHMSPFEHQATPEHWYSGSSFDPQNGNFDSTWEQYRKTIPGENIESYNPKA